MKLFTLLIVHFMMIEYAIAGGKWKPRLVLLDPKVHKFLNEFAKLPFEECEKIIVTGREEKGEWIYRFDTDETINSEKLTYEKLNKFCQNHVTNDNISTIAWRIKTIQKDKFYLSLFSPEMRAFLDEFAKLPAAEREKFIIQTNHEGLAYYTIKGSINSEHFTKKKIKKFWKSQITVKNGILFVCQIEKTKNLIAVR